MNFYENRRTSFEENSTASGSPICFYADFSHFLSKIRNDDKLMKIG